MRRIVVGLARQLAERGIGSHIGDLPGSGESLVETGNIVLQDWHDAVAALTKQVSERTGRLPHLASLRGGALIDLQASGASWWRFAPASGSELMRAMRRTQRFSASTDEGYGGYRIAPGLEQALDNAVVSPPEGPCRESSVLIEGTPIWRRAEPDDDSNLVSCLAADLVGWIEACEASSS